MAVESAPPAELWIWAVTTMEFTLEGLFRLAAGKAFGSSSSELLSLMLYVPVRPWLFRGGLEPNKDFLERRGSLPCLLLAIPGVTLVCKEKHLQVRLLTRVFGSNAVLKSFFTDFDNTCGK